jgi:MGT family glycosyltransferase
MYSSGELNLTIYPAEVDYARDQPLGPTWTNLEASVRSTDDPWELPDELRSGKDPLLYLSLGSLGSADVELMRKLIASLADTRYRVIVSKGPQHDQLELASNMVGEEFLPQASILPMVDLVITHGGNNTVTESLWFGRPMVVLPLFWDQYDNAQRMHETGFGRRLDTYRHEPQELTGAIDELLEDAELAERLSRLSARLQQAPGTVRAADLLERVAAGQRP